MRCLDRRRFLLSLGLGAGGAAAAAWCWPQGSLKGRHAPEEDPGGNFDRRELRDLAAVTQHASAFGTTASVTVLDADANLAERAAARALEELQRVDRLMSVYRPESQLSRLNREGVLPRPHPYLVTLLGQAEAFSRTSGGAFDVTVQPLWTLYAEAARAGQRPEPAALRAAVAKVDWRRVALGCRKVELLGRGTAVTLNGIAQGFAADRAREVLRRLGIRHALIDAGEIAAIGGKTLDNPWTVGIQHPRRDDAYLALAGLRGRCLATSGDYATHFSEDFRDHHVFDPRTGRSPVRLASVSVAAATATEADALATAVMVLGPEEGLRLVHRTRGADALMVLKDGTTLASEGFPSVPLSETCS